MLLVFAMEWHCFIAVFHGWPSPRLEVQSFGLGGLIAAGGSPSFFALPVAVLGV